MYRILIVDDQPYVVDWLSSLLESRAELELDICRAYSSAEALKWLNRTKIDIIITDIQMPEMDGIALAEKVRQNWPQSKIIFLTAHAEFDYAYMAIKNNVVGFILKTEEDERIIAEVNKAVALLNQEIKNTELLDQVQDQLKNSTMLIRKEILLSILKDERSNKSELYQQLKRVGSYFTAEKLFLMFVGRIENGLAESDIVNRFVQSSSVLKITEQYFGHYFHIECVEYSYNKIVWLLQLKDDCGLDSGESIAIAGREALFASGMLETVQQSCLDNSNINISFIMHGELLDKRELTDVFQNLDYLMRLCAADNTGFIMTDTALNAAKGNDTQNNQQKSKRLIAVNIEEILKSHLENCRHDEYMAELNALAGQLEKYKNWHSMAAWEIFHAIAGAIISFINQHELRENFNSSHDLNILLHPQIADSWSNVADYLRKISEILFTEQQKERKEVSGNIVHFLREYIENHITLDISLTKLSEISGYSTVYLSKTYKKSTGETISDFASRMKLAKIRELMANENLNISDIATKAGFEYRTYFNRFIKKYTGMSPQEFRRSLS